MTPPTSTRSLPTFSFPIPDYWTPEEALAVFQVLDDLRQLIWAQYSEQLIDAYREQLTPKDTAQYPTNRDTPDDQPF